MGAIIPIFIPHVGCPHDCVFCNQKKIAGTLSAPDAFEVSERIEAALKVSGAQAEVAFYGGSFTAIPKEQMEGYLLAVQPFIESGAVSALRVSTRPDAIDEERLFLLSRYGVRTIELGAQSMVDSVLTASGRGHTSEDTEKAARLIKEKGFSLILQMMTHLPGSDDEKDIETAMRISELKPAGVRIYPTVVIADTYLETLWREGKYIPVAPETAAVLGARIIEIFERANIPVIRFGLNPTEDLSSGEALSGAYHPALGEMAQSERYLGLAEREIEKKNLCGGEISVFVNPKRISTMSGIKKINKKRLSEKYGFSKIKIIGDEALRGGEIRVEKSREL